MGTGLCLCYLNNAMTQLKIHSMDAFRLNTHAMSFVTLALMEPVTDASLASSKKEADALQFAATGLGLDMKVATMETMFS